MAFDDLAFQAGDGVPELGGAVAAAGDEGLAVGREGDGEDFAVVAGESGAFVAGGGVPQDDGAVAAAGGQGLAVRGEGEGVDPLRLPVERQGVAAGDFGFVRS
jgi:hypothetical protein